MPPRDGTFSRESSPTIEERIALERIPRLESKKSRSREARGDPNIHTMKRALHRSRVLIYAEAENILKHGC